MNNLDSPRTSNKRRSLRFAGVLLVCGLLVVGCSKNAEDLSDAELHDELVEVLTEDDTLTDSEANCVVDGLFEGADREQLNRMANADENDELSDEDTNLLFDVMFDCIEL